jgi:uncharacterized membrane protein YeaQ/YmgE (transglycosylase-associated protein family)
MGILLFIVFGALVGWVASMIMGSGGGLLWDIVIGIIGSILGGWIMSYFGGYSVTGFNLTSFIVALIGAVVLILIVRLLRRV